MINLAFKDYTGRNVRLAILDTGCVEGVHCLDKNGQHLSKDDVNMSFDHIKKCVSIIKNIAPDSECVTINVGDNDTGIITEKAAIEGIKTAMSVMPKIIVISFSFAYATNEFISVINNALDKGIIICASVDPVVKQSYPQIIKGVISVDEIMDSENGREITLVNNVFKIKSNLYGNVINDHGSSFANAYFAGKIARFVEFSPLITGESLLSFFHNDNDIKDSESEHNAFWLISNQHNLDDIKDIINTKYEYYYDNDEGVFREILTDHIAPSDSIKSIDVVCGDDFICKFPTEFNEFKNRQTPYYCYNNFSENINYFQEDLNANKAITIPSIYIFSYGMDKDKFKIHTYLYRHFIDKGYQTGNVSFNPIAKLIGFKYITYPNTILYPDYIYHLNNCIYEEALDRDILILSGAGSFDRFVGFEHRFGDTSKMLVEANVPDITILSIVDSISVSEIKKAVLYIENTVGAKVLLFLSQKSTDDDYYGPIDYNLINSESTTIAYAKELSAQLERPVFTFKDFENNNMFDYIIELFD